VSTKKRQLIFEIIDKSSVNSTIVRDLYKNYLMIMQALTRTDFSAHS